MSLSIALAALGKGAMNLISTYTKKQSADSLVSLTQSARVEPVTMIDETLRTAPYLEDVLHSLVSLFSGYYLQAIALTSSISSVNVLNRLDSLNPNRNNGFRVTGLESGNVMLEPLNYSFGLPRVGQSYGLEAYGTMDPAQVRASLEAIEANSSGIKLKEKVETADGKTKDIYLQPTGMNIDASAAEGSSASWMTKVDDIIQSAPLSIGKMLDVTIEEDGKKLRVPVSVRLLSTTIKPFVLTHILSDGTKNITWKERWHGWRSGELELWRDVILATDLVDEHRKAMAQDTTGAYQEILARRRGNLKSAALTATPSLATASNLMVISKATARDVEMKVRGRLTDVKTRNKIFQMSYLMILVVVDTDNEMVSFYHRGIPLPTTVSIRELKVSSKGNGPDVADILSKLMLGQNPSL